MSVIGRCLKLEMPEMDFPFIPWGLDHKEGWARKNWCFWTVILEKTPESPLDSMEIKPVNPKGNQPWIFIGRTDAEAEAPNIWPPDTKSQVTGKDWRQEKRVTEDEMVGWHHWLNGHEIEQTPGDGEGLWSLLCSYEVAKSWTRVSNWTMTTWGVGHGPALQLDLGLVKPILELWPPSCKIICISLSHGVCGNWLELQ